MYTHPVEQCKSKFLPCTSVSVELSVCPVSLESALSLGISHKSDISNNNAPAVGFPSEKELSL